MIYNKTILVTGAAGFIGYHLVERLLWEGWNVIGLDSINENNDILLKYARLAQSGIQRDRFKYNQLINSNKHPTYQFIQLMMEDNVNLSSLFEKFSFGVVCNLGGQAGVRYSIENPMAYVNSNIIGFTNILEQCQIHKVEHLVYASSSSIYGLNSYMPFSIHHSANHPVSFYAATKKCNELMAHVYSKIYDIPTTGLRFFTVYGPWGRPDMSPMLFADAIMHKRPIKVFNNGEMCRDFTYIDDIVEGVFRVINIPATADLKWDKLNPDPATSNVPYRIYNIGNSSPIKLLDFIKTLEDVLGVKAIKEYYPMQPGDVINTFCDVSDLEINFNYIPQTTLHQGLETFAKWYKEWMT
jgi:UDP-glucuronate 4-epimerase